MSSNEYDTFIADIYRLARLERLANNLANQMSALRKAKEAKKEAREDSLEIAVKLTKSTIADPKPSSEPTPPYRGYRGGYGF